MGTGGSVAMEATVEEAGARVGSPSRRESPGPVATRVVGSPLGELVLVAGERGLREIRWPDSEWTEGTGALPVPGPETHLRAQDAQRWGGCDQGTARAEAHLDDVARQLDEYFRGARQAFDLALDPVGTPFQQRAWAVLRTIPFGETFSYGQQAAALGDPRSTRAVGSANGRNPLPIVVPCHRVIGADGTLTGFSAGLGRKKWLLEHERQARPAS